MKSLLRFFFRLLYHQFAFTYDLVAAAVSLNRWKEWVRSVIPFVEGNRVLEIGHGPGHLQRVLLSGGLCAVGIDESAQMGQLAKRNLTRQPIRLSSRQAEKPYTQINLVRGLGQQLPFPDEAFDTIVATFPTEYITDADTLAEVKRCLCIEGKLIVLPVAWPKSRFLDWLFKVTKQAPAEALEIVKSKIRKPFEGAGLETDIQMLHVKSGILLIVLARNHAQKTSRTGQ